LRLTGAMPPEVVFGKDGPQRRRDNAELAVLSALVDKI
jgi:hypothetical protein